MGIFTVVVVIIGTSVCMLLSDIKIELRYRNTLLEKQNDILKQGN